MEDDISDFEGVEGFDGFGDSDDYDNFGDMKDDFDLSLSDNSDRSDISDGSCGYSTSSKYDTSKKEIPQVTHLCIKKLAISSFPKNTPLRQIKFTRLVGLEGDMDDLGWGYMVARSNNVRALLTETFMNGYYEQDLLFNRLNITNINIFDNKSCGPDNIPFLLQQIANFTNLRQLSLNLDSSSFIYMDLLTYLLKSPKEKPIDCTNNITKLFETMNALHGVLAEASTNPQFVDLMTSSKSKKIVDEITPPFLLEQKKVLHSEVSERELRNHMDESENKYYNPSKDLIADYKSRYPEAFNLISKIIESSTSKKSDPQYFNEVFCLDLILRPEVFSLLWHNHPSSGISLLPTLNSSCKVFQNKKFQAERSSRFLWADWQNLAKPFQIPIPSFNPSQSAFANFSRILSRVMFAYSVTEHLMKIVLEDLPNLEYLNVFNNTPSLLHSFWLRRVVKQHKNLNEITIMGPGNLYKRFESEWGFMMEVHRLPRSTVEEHKKLVQSMVNIPKSLEDYITTDISRPVAIDEIYSRYKVLSDNIMKIDVEGIRKGYQSDLCGNYGNEKKDTESPPSSFLKKPEILNYYERSEEDTDKVVNIKQLGFLPPTSKTKPRFKRLYFTGDKMDDSKVF